MSTPNPALVSERAAAPLPRLPLFLLCAAYLLPGLFGREPWKAADVAAYGAIVAIAEGRTPWLTPAVAGVPLEGGLLPYWIGAAFVRASAGWIEPILAARIPFVLLLAATLCMTWYATYRLARAESAQPLPFAFGGEAAGADYARAIADGALLALIASLGLLQLGHETTPELVQLAAAALFLFGTAAVPDRPRAGLPAIVVALPALAASGAPTVALLLAAVGAAVAVASRPNRWGRLVVASAVGAVLAVAVATVMHAWAVRVDVGWRVLDWLRSLVWFGWPAWLLAAWTLWQWRRRLLAPHLAMPIASVATLLVVSLAMSGSDRALLLALPALAAVAAFALPTLQRSTAAAIDWFSVFFFSIAACAVWLFYVAMQTGTPAKLAANVAKLSPGYANRFSMPALVAAVLATLAWLWLVRWRTGRHRHPLWKSLVLPASGVSLVWLLVMTLLLPPLDNARSYRSMMQRVGRYVPAGGCLLAPGLARAPAAALESIGGWRVDARTRPSSTPGCDWLIVTDPLAAPKAPWRFVARERRLRKDDDAMDIYRRDGG